MVDKVLKILVFCLLFFGYLLLNIGLDDYFSGFEFLIIVSLIMVVSSAIIIIKKKYYKLSIVYLFVLVFYSLFYTYIGINNDYKYEFLEKLDSYTYEENDYYKELDLESCLEDEACDYRKALNRKIKNVNFLLENPEGFKSVSYLNYKLSNILKNKNIIENKGLNYNFDIDFNIDDYIRQSLVNSYINSLESADLENYNLLFSGDQFKKYSKDYYYNVYESMKTGKYKNLKSYDKDSFLLFFINRRYKYNVYLEDYENIREFTEKVKKTYELVSEINYDKNNEQ